MPGMLPTQNVLLCKTFLGQTGEPFPLGREPHGTESARPTLPALWAPAKLTWCNPGGTRPHSPVQPEYCCAGARNGKLLPPDGPTLVSL